MKIRTAYCEFIQNLPSFTELPNVKLTDCADIPLVGYDKCLSIQFSHGKDFAGLSHVNQSPNVLEGVVLGNGKVEIPESGVSVIIRNGVEASVS